MTVVWKYTFPLGENGMNLSLPRGAKFLSTCWQHETVAMWFEVDSRWYKDSRYFKERTFFFVGTGHELPTTMSLTHKFLGSVYTDQAAFVFHVYEMEAE